MGQLVSNAGWFQGGILLRSHTFQAGHFGGPPFF